MGTLELLILAWLIIGLLAGLAAAREIDGAVTLGNLFFIGLAMMGGPFSYLMFLLLTHSDVELFKL